MVASFSTRSDPSHLSEKLIIFTLGYRLQGARACVFVRICGGMTSAGLGSTPEIACTKGWCVCVCVGARDLRIDFPRTLWILGQLSLEPSGPDLLPSELLSPSSLMFLHPLVPGRPRISLLSNVSLDHLIGLRFCHTSLN